MMQPALLDELKAILREDYGYDPVEQELPQIAGALIEFLNLLLKIPTEQINHN